MIKNKTTKLSIKCMYFVLSKIISYLLVVFRSIFFIKKNSIYIFIKLGIFFKYNAVLI